MDILRESHLNNLIKIIGENNLKFGHINEILDEGVSPGNLDADVIASPQSAQHVSQLIKHCSENNIAIVPQGGRTGLSGAAQSEPGQLIIQTSKLNSILGFDTDAGVVIVESGVTLQQLQETVYAQGYSTGIDLAARGSATIGGMVATNAGGTQAFRFGNMRHRVLGLEVVLANGEILSDLKQVIKANEGFDIKQLFIGAEGTLGIITKICLRLVPAETSRSSALISCENTKLATSVFQRLRKGTDFNLLNIEIMWPDYAHTTAEQLGLRKVLDFSDSENDIFILIDLASTSSRNSLQILEHLLAQYFDEGIISSAVIAQNEREAQDFWAIREESFHCDKKYPDGFWFDVSVPLNQLDCYTNQLFENIRHIDADLKVFLFGHLGDGNLHITISKGCSCTELEASINEAVYEGLNQIGGSFSAEHGIGNLKTDSLYRYCDPSKLALMQGIKHTFDPKGIMNPGKIIINR